MAVTARGIRWSAANAAGLYRVLIVRDSSAAFVFYVYHIIIAGILSREPHPGNVCPSHGRLIDAMRALDTGDVLKWPRRGLFMVI